MAGGGAYFFRALAAAVVDRMGPTTDADIAAALWELAWSGRVTGDTLAPLRGRLGGGRTAHRTRAARPVRGRYAGSGAGLASYAASGRAAVRPAPPAVAGRWALAPRAGGRPHRARTCDGRGAARPLRRRDARGGRGRGHRPAATRPSTRCSRRPRRPAGSAAGTSSRDSVPPSSPGPAPSTGCARPPRSSSRPARPPSGTSGRVDVRTLVLAAADPANAYGAALPWPARPGDGAGSHRPGRKAGALVVLVDGELVLYVERGGRTLLSWSEDPDQLQAAADALGPGRARRRPRPADRRASRWRGCPRQRPSAGPGAGAVRLPRDPARAAAAAIGRARRRRRLAHGGPAPPGPRRPGARPLRSALAGSLDDRPERAHGPGGGRARQAPPDPSVHPQPAGPGRRAQPAPDRALAPADGRQLADRSDRSPVRPPSFAGATTTSARSWPTASGRPPGCSSGCSTLSRPATSTRSSVTSARTSWVRTGIRPQVVADPALAAGADDRRGIAGPARPCGGRHVLPGRDDVPARSHTVDPGSRPQQRQPHQLRPQEGGDDPLDRIVERVRRLLLLNRDRVGQVTTGDARPGHEAFVHGRSGRPCRRCGTTVRVAPLGTPPTDRVAFYCPTCQRGPAPTDDGRQQRPLGSSRRAR